MRKQRKNVSLSASVNPVVLRAFNRATRNHFRGRLVERLLVLYIQASQADRVAMGVAGRHNSLDDAKARNAHRVECAAEIVKRRREDADAVTLPDGWQFVYEARRYNRKFFSAINYDTQKVFISTLASEAMHRTLKRAAVRMLRENRVQFVPAETTVNREA